MLKNFFLQKNEDETKVWQKKVGYQIKVNFH